MKKGKNEFVVKLIKTYQKNKQIIGVGHCKFYPTCSTYALETYQKFNFFYASILVGIRILRCNALAKRRYYPVKLTKEEKKVKLYLNKIKITFDDDFIDYLQSLANLKINEADLYSYIYDYYYLPIHPHFETNHNTIYTSRFIISEKPVNIDQSFTNKLSFNDYINITNELFQKELIYIQPNNILNKESNKFLIPIDLIKLNELLDFLEITNGIIILNNYFEQINYLDFEIISFTTNKLKDFKKLIKEKDKLIILTNNLNILEYLEFVNYSINFYNDAREINYFYHLNKRAK